MGKQAKKQANFRLPEELLNDLRMVTPDDKSQTAIVTEAISKKVERLKLQMAKREAASV